MSCSMQNVSQLAPIFGCASCAARVHPVPSSECRIPVSLTYTFGLFTSRLPMLATKGGKRRTRKTPSSTSRAAATV